MTYKDLSQETKDLIKKYLEKIVKRATGCDVTFTLGDPMSKRDDEMFKVTSSDINFTPSIFNRLFIEGFGYVFPQTNEEGREYLLIQFSLNYRWEYFDLGTNGTSLGSCQLSVLEDGHFKYLSYGPFETNVSMPIKFS